MKESKKKKSEKEQKTPMLSVFLPLQTKPNPETAAPAAPIQYLFRIGEEVSKPHEGPTLVLQITDLSSLFECVLSGPVLEMERVRQGVIFGDIGSMVTELCCSAAAAVWEVERFARDEEMKVTMRATIDDRGGLGEMLFNFSMKLINVGRERFASEVVMRMLVCASELSRWVAAMGQLMASKDAEAAQCKQQFPATRAIMRSQPFDMDAFADKMIASPSNLLSPSHLHAAARSTSQASLSAFQEVLSAADLAACALKTGPHDGPSAAAPEEAVALSAALEAPLQATFANPAFSLSHPPLSASFPASLVTPLLPEDGSNDGVNHNSNLSASLGAGSSLGLLIDLKQAAEASLEPQRAMLASAEIVDPHAVVHKFANDAVYVETKEELERKRKREEDLEEQRKKSQAAKAQAAKRFKI